MTKAEYDWIYESLERTGYSGKIPPVCTCKFQFKNNTPYIVIHTWENFKPKILKIIREDVWFRKEKLKKIKENESR